MIKPTARCFTDTATVVLSLSFLLTSCAGILDLDSPSTISGGARMAPPLIVDGAGNPAPELQVRTNPDDYNESGVQETHAATTAEACREMARRYQKEGRKISLKDIRESGDPNLPYLCVFEGADAVEGYYQNDRYGKDN